MLDLNEKHVATKTSVTFLLDRSGSMNAIKQETIGAFNAYLNGLEADGITFTLVQFDSGGIDKMCVRVPVAQAPRLDDNNFQPRGYTPLIDAAYRTIKAVEESVDGDSKVIICIQTDGEENASREYDWAALNKLIKEKSASGWQFNFLGAGIDAYSQGAKMGIARADTMSYDSTDAKKSLAAFSTRAESHRSYAMGQSVNTSISDTERDDAGDKFAKKKDNAGAFRL